MSRRFTLVLGGVVLAIAIFGSARSSSQGPSGAGSAHAGIYAPPQPQPPLTPSADHLRPTASRFLHAFLRYEVGYLRRPRPLRRLATPQFAAQLLSEPARPAGRSRSPARLTHLAIRRLSWRPARALLLARARRADGSEQLAFLFEAHRGHWRAVGPAE